MSRTFTAHAVAYHARAIQDRAFLGGLFWSVCFITFAIFGSENAAMACALVACFGYGVSAGSWLLGSRFKD